LNPVIKSVHTHAGGETEGWFGAATHPAFRDSSGDFVSGTEWTTKVDKAYTSLECLARLDNNVFVETLRRKMFAITCDVCKASMSGFIIDNVVPELVCEEKGDSYHHSFIYKS